MAKYKRADELEPGDRISLWAGLTGEVEGEVNDVTPAEPGFLLIELVELDWCQLHVRASEDVLLAE